MENRWARSPFDYSCACTDVAPGELCTRANANGCVYGDVYNNCTYTEIYEPLPLFLQLNYGKEILETEGRRTGGAEANYTL